LRRIFRYAIKSHFLYRKTGRQFYISGVDHCMPDQFAPLDRYTWPDGGGGVEERVIGVGARTHHAASCRMTPLNELRCMSLDIEGRHALDIRSRFTDFRGGRLRRFRFLHASPPRCPGTIKRRKCVVVVVLSPIDDGRLRKIQFRIALPSSDRAWNDTVARAHVAGWKLAAFSIEVGGHDDSFVALRRARDHHGRLFHKAFIVKQPETAFAMPLRSVFPFG
jgi:hypothetical protein